MTETMPDLFRKKKQKRRRLFTLVISLCVLFAMFAVPTFADEAATVAETGESTGMVGLVEDIFSAFSTVIEGLSDGLKAAFSNLLYVDPDVANPQFSPLVLFIFTMAGIALATGVLYKIFGLIRARRG